MVLGSVRRVDVKAPHMPLFAKASGCHSVYCCHQEHDYAIVARASSRVQTAHHNANSHDHDTDEGDQNDRTRRKNYRLTPPTQVFVRTPVPLGDVEDGDPASGVSPILTAIIGADMAGIATTARIAENQVLSSQFPFT